MSRVRVAALLALPLVAAACGATESGSTTTSIPEPATTAPVSPEPTVVAAYFLRDGKVAPVAERVPHTEAVATAALTTLLAGPPEGYASEIPEGARDATVRIADGLATVTVPDALSEPTEAAAAQIVYTLTRFATVSAVELRLADGTVVLPRATRAGYEEETPLILVESPLPGAETSSPLRVSGTASVFEATVRLELVRDGEILAATTATAAEGAPGRGAFAAELPFEGSGAATLVAYSPNVGDGGPPKLHEVDVPVTLAP